MTLSCVQCEIGIGQDFFLWVIHEIQASEIYLFSIIWSSQNVSVHLSKIRKHEKRQYYQNGIGPYFGSPSKLIILLTNLFFSLLHKVYFICFKTHWMHQFRSYYLNISYIGMEEFPCQPATAPRSVTVLPPLNFTSLAWTLTFRSRKYPDVCIPYYAHLPVNS